MHSKMEELYLEAEADIRNNSYVEAFRKYETILYEEPGNAPTLNSLGWLYKTQIEDYKKAEKFYIYSRRNRKAKPLTAGTGMPPCLFPGLIISDCILGPINYSVPTTAAIPGK